jgi:hypothetical protein
MANRSIGSLLPVTIKNIVFPCFLQIIAKGVSEVCVVRKVLRSVEESCGPPFVIAELNVVLGAIVSSDLRAEG